jgi:tetratricopeptide (TPR) repeat protein
MRPATMSLRLVTARLFSLGLALWLTAAAPSAARADDAAASAREHYQKGTTLYDLGRYADAIKEFEAAYQIKNDPALLYNLAQSNRLAGNSEQALHFYRTYLRYVPNAKNRAEIEDRIKQLDQIVKSSNPSTSTTPPNQTGTNSQTQPPPPPPPDTTATNPINPNATTPPPPPPPDTTATNPINPNTATPPATGTPAFTAAPPPPAPGLPPATPNDHHGMILTGQIITGVGAVLFIVGAAYGAQAVGAANEVNKEAVNGMPFDPSVESRGKSAQHAEAVLVPLGLLAGAAGAGLWLYGRHLRSQESAQLTPMASADGAGLMLRGSF